MMRAVFYKIYIIIVMRSIASNLILQQDNPSCQENFLKCHLKIKSALFFDDLKFKSALT